MSKLPPNPELSPVNVSDFSPYLINEPVPLTLPALISDKLFVKFKDALPVVLS